MPNNKFIEELRNLLRMRGSITKAQREYAKAEEMALMQMHPITKPHEEKRSTHLRNLKSYIGERAIRMILEGRSDLVPLPIRVEGKL